ncbi:EamA family transporter [Caminibacter mediatlanticus]|uniref:EamA family transporter n=1 Tax=Caminibacter mediatlanticus TaxID=291048 RepID=UPI003CC8206E
MWRWSISIIGANKTSNYIYLVPLINSIASIIFLNELINIHIIIASILIILGLYFSQK